MKLGKFFIASLLLAACGEVNQFADAGDTCNDNNPCTVDSVGADGECEFVAGNAGAVCREAAGDCDVAEECTGDSTACPDDVIADAGEVCRASGNSCDPSEACDGESVACPDDVGLEDGTYLIGAAGAEFAGDLRVIDPTDGSTLRSIGPIGYGVSGLAQHPTTGVLYGTTSARDATAATSLISIDLATGAGTLIGAGGRNADLDFASDGTLYAWDENNDDLVTVDPQTGAVAVVGESSLNTWGSGMAFDVSGNIWFAGSGNTGILHQISRASGTVAGTPATLNGATVTEGTGVPSLAFDPATGLLYAVVIDNGGGGDKAVRHGGHNGRGGGLGRGTGGGGGAIKGIGKGSGGEPTPKQTFLVQVNTVTGAITTLGQTFDNLDAIEFVTCE